jgi:hypothetical protein
MEELEGGDSTSTAHESVYTRGRAQKERKLEWVRSLFLRVHRIPLVKELRRSYHLHLKQAWNSHGAWRLPEEGSLGEVPAGRHER